ncbi:hypothetical protein CBL_08258 [Carabus blaptoides fortunei]
MDNIWDENSELIETCRIVEILKKGFPKELKIPTPPDDDIINQRPKTKDVKTDKRNAKKDKAGEKQSQGKAKKK